MIYKYDKFALRSNFNVGEIFGEGRNQSETAQRNIAQLHMWIIQKHFKHLIRGQRNNEIKVTFISLIFRIPENLNRTDKPSINTVRGKSLSSSGGILWRWIFPNGKSLSVFRSRRAEKSN